MQFVILEGSAGGACSVPPTPHALRILTSPNTTETLALSLLFPLNTTQGGPLMLRNQCLPGIRACAEVQHCCCCCPFPHAVPLHLPGIELACWFWQARAAVAQKTGTNVRRQLDAWLSWVSICVASGFQLHDSVQLLETGPGLLAIAPVVQRLIAQPSNFLSHCTASQLEPGNGAADQLGSITNPFLLVAGVARCLPTAACIACSFAVQLCSWSELWSCAAAVLRRFSCMEKQQPSPYGGSCRCTPLLRSPAGTADQIVPPGNSQAMASASPACFDAMSVAQQPPADKLSASCSTVLGGQDLLWFIADCPIASQHAGSSPAQCPPAAAGRRLHLVAAAGGRVPAGAQRPPGAGGMSRIHSAVPYDMRNYTFPWRVVVLATLCRLLMEWLH